MQILTKWDKTVLFPQRLLREDSETVRHTHNILQSSGKNSQFFSFTAVKLEPEGQEKGIMCPVQPQQLQSHQGERLIFGRSTQPCPPANAWSERSCFVPKKYGIIIPSYRGRSGMICGRLVASPEQSWGWNFGDSRAPAPSLLLSSTVGNGFTENSQSTQGIRGSQTEQLLLVPGMFSDPMGSVLQFSSTQKWNVLEDLEHTGNLQDKTSNHRKLSVPIQTKK